MTAERGASRWTVAALLAVIIGAVVAIGVAQGWFGGEAEPVEPEASETQSTQASVDTSTSTTSTVVPPQSTSVGDHPLCVSYADLVAAVSDHLPVEGADDLEAYVTAQIAFHQSAVEILDPPEEEGFASQLGWHEALVDYYEPLEWNPSPGLDFLVENPPPQPDPAATASVANTLEELCGVVPTQDVP